MCISRFRNCTVGGKDPLLSRRGWNRSFLKQKMKIKHVKFGEGTIISVKESGKNTVIDVAFKGVGIKSLVAALAPIEVIE